MSNCVNVIHEGAAHGLPIRIKEFGRHGRYWQCGHVKLPDGHPWRDLDLQFMHYNVVPIRGGITFGPTGDGWIGFDTNKQHDTWPNSDPTPMEPWPWQRGAGDEPVTWTEGLMFAETERLAALAVQAIEGVRS